MLIDKTTQYIIGYSTLSVLLLSWSVHDSLKKSYNYTMFLIEMTDGLKLGIFLNFVIFLFLVVNKILQLVLFGSLRMIEVEHLFEKLPIFAINLFLNLATGDNNVILNVFLIGIAMSFKVMHIIMLDRLDFLNLQIFNIVNDDDDERFQSIGVLQIVFHYLGSINFWLNFIFIGIDFALAKILVYDVFQGINSVTCLLFGFQFAVQGVENLTHFAKVLLNFYEIVFFKIRKNSRRRERAQNLNMESNENENENEIEEEEENENVEPSGNLGESNQVFMFDADDDDSEVDIVWESKPYYSKAIDISSALLTAIAYLCFIYLLTFHSGISLPLSMLHGTYSSLKKAWVQTSQLLAFIESSKRLDYQLPNATKEDLEELDSLCIICREDMYAVEEYQRLYQKPQSPRRCAKKLQCNHILHLGCLKEWMERSDSCPLCRRKVFGGPPPTFNPTPPTSAQEAPPPPPPLPPQQDIQPEQEPQQAESPESFNVSENLNSQVPDSSRENSAMSTGTTSETNSQSAENMNNTSHPYQHHTNMSSSEQGSLDRLEPTRTVPSSQSTTSSSPVVNDGGGGVFQSIRLPRSALLPPDWVLLPLQRTEEEGVDYKVSVSLQHQVNMQIRKRDNDGQLE